MFLNGKNHSAEERALPGTLRQKAETRMQPLSAEPGFVKFLGAKESIHWNRFLGSLNFFRIKALE
jgi:hypothetical protein